jgi:hypothetical protein
MQPMVIAKRTSAATMVIRPNMLGDMIRKGPAGGKRVIAHRFGEQESRDLSAAAFK